MMQPVKFWTHGPKQLASAIGSPCEVGVEFEECEDEPTQLMRDGDRKEGVIAVSREDILDAQLCCVECLYLNKLAAQPASTVHAATPQRELLGSGPLPHTPSPSERGMRFFPRLNDFVVRLLNCVGV